MVRPTFKDLVEFVRSWVQASPEQAIGPDTELERDLGVTGDDGGYLLQGVEKHFAVQLATKEDGYRKTFDLGKNEYLFNSEGFPLWELLPFVPKSSVRVFTVGQLYEALASAAEASS